MADPAKDEAFRAWIHKLADQFGASGAGTATPVASATAGARPGSPPAASTAAGARPGSPAATAITEDQWTGLLLDFVQAVQIWCNGMQHVVNQFERDVGQRAETEDVSLQASILKNVIDELLPAQLKLAKTIAEAPLNGLIHSIQSGAVTLRDFCSSWNSAFEQFKGNRREHEAMFSRFRAEMIEVGNSFQEVSGEIGYLAERLPQPAGVRRTMLQAWIDSTEDEGGLIDEWEDIAGYFRVNVTRLGVNDWQLASAVLDDTDEQTGVIATLQREYGRTTPLERLPFPMRLFIMHGIHNEVTVAEKGKSGSLAFKTGTQQVFDDWRRSGKAIPTTANLTEETLFGN